MWAVFHALHVDMHWRCRCGLWSTVSFLSLVMCVYFFFSIYRQWACTTCGHGQRWPPRAGWGFTRQCSDRGQGWGFAQGKRWWAPSSSQAELSAGLRCARQGNAQVQGSPKKLSWLCEEEGQGRRGKGEQSTDPLQHRTSRTRMPVRLDDVWTSCYSDDNGATQGKNGTGKMVCSCVL
jgi:hypothetical protein